MARLVLPDIAISSSVLSERPEVESIKFGDGFVLDTATGINNIAREYRLSWVGITIEQSNTLRDFVRKQGAVERIEWIPFGEPNTQANRVGVSWVCTSWDHRTISGGAFANFTATLVERFTGYGEDN